MGDLVIVGCGGHGREILDTVSAINAVAPTWNVLGFVDDDPDNLDRLDRLGHRVLGPISWLEAHPGHYALGIGSSELRSTITARIDRVGGEATTLVHPDAVIGSDIELDDGVVVFAGTVITTNVRIGRHTHLNVGCAVQHDSLLGDFVQMSPGVFVNGDCVVGDGVFLGTGAVITRGCSIGAGARVGAGSVVLDDVDAGSTVVGAPARRSTPPPPTG